MTIPTRLDSNQLARLGFSREQADVLARAEGIQAYIAARQAAADVVVAQSTADGAVVIANGKNKTFYQTSAPTASAVGDIWFDTDDNYKPYRWDGAVWQLVHDSTPVTSAEIVDGAVITAKLAAAGVTADKIGAALPGDNLVRDSQFNADSDANGEADGWQTYNNSPGTQPTTTSIVTDADGTKWQRVTWSVANTSTKGIMLVGGDAWGVQGRWQPNKTYVIMFEARGVGGVIGSGNMLLGWNTAPSVTTVLKDPVLTGTRQKYAFKITWGASVEVLPVGGLYISVAGGGMTGSIDIGRVMVVDGDIECAYAPRVSELYAGAIGATELAVDAVTTTKLAAGAVTAAKIAAHTITANEIAADTITANEIAANAITTSELSALAVTAAKIAANTITAGQIAAGTITATELATDSVIAAKIQAGAVTAGKIAAGAITADKVSANEIVTAKLSTARGNTQGNAFPNPTSEFAPPSSYTPPNDGSDPEFDFRFDTGSNTGGHSGRWVRRFNLVANGSLTMKLVLPAHEGQWYVLDLWANRQTALTHGAFQAFIKAFDGNGTAVADVNVALLSFNTWIHMRGAKKMPAGTVRVELWLVGTASLGNGLDVWVDDIQFYRGVDVALMCTGSVFAAHRNNAAQSIPNATVTSLTMNLSDADSDSACATNPWKFTVPSDKLGYYRITAMAVIDGAGALTEAWLSVYINGTEFCKLDRMQSEVDGTSFAPCEMNYCGLSGSTIFQFVQPGDFVEVKAWQNSGASKNTVPHSNITIERLAGFPYPVL
jgi:hypothetical protein